MLKKIKCSSQQRWSWLLLAGSALLLLALALYFQYGLNLQPCIKCIYIRAAIAGILLASIVGLLSPTSTSLRLLAIIGWLASAIAGMLQAADLVEIENLLQSGGFFSCALFADFPSWLALDKWMPSVFEPTGSCGNTDWQFMGYSMAFWSWVILWGYIVSAVMVLLSQMVKLSKNPYL